MLTNQRLTQGGGFNPANPTAVTSANQIDPNLKAPMTDSFVAGVDRELMAHFALQVNYSYTRTTNLFGNYTANITPRVGVTLADYTAGPMLTGTLPDGASLQRADVRRQRRQGRRRRRRVPDDDGARLLDRLPRRRGGAREAAVEPLDGPRRLLATTTRAITSQSDAGRYDTNGNPTPTLNEPLVDGGQFAPSSSASSGSGTVYMNAKWQFNANGMYQAPLGIEASANVFGRQGYPFPLFRTQALGGESLPVLVTPTIDYFRYDNVWDTDVRAARAFKFQTISLRVDRRRLQPVQREHGARAEQQHPVDDVQPDRAEPEPADLPARRRGEVLASPTVVFHEDTKITKYF